MKLKLFFMFIIINSLIFSNEENIQKNQEDKLLTYGAIEVKYEFNNGTYSDHVLGETRLGTSISFEYQYEYEYDLLYLGGGFGIQTSTRVKDKIDGRPVEHFADFVPYLTAKWIVKKYGRMGVYLLGRVGYASNIKTGSVNLTTSYYLAAGAGIKYNNFVMEGLAETTGYEVDQIDNNSKGRYNRLTFAIGYNFKL